MRDCERVNEVEDMTAFLYSFDGRLHCIDVQDVLVDNGESLRWLASRYCGVRCHFVSVLNIR